MNNSKQKIEGLVLKIRGLHDACMPVANSLKDKIAQISANYTGDESGLPGSYWRLVAYCDAVTRVRILTERNFVYIETLAILATTRYLFELSIWIKLLEKSDTYGLLYYRMWIKGQQEHSEALLAQLRREIALLKKLESSERNQLKEAVSRSSDRNEVDSFAEAMRSITESIDEEAANQFSIYSDDAKINGYGFQAHLIEKKAVPESQRVLAESNAWLEAFDMKLSASLRDIRPKGPWKWKDMAEKVDMGDEYDFIYSYSSRMLHATPASLTTNQPALEEIEVYIFLRYCAVKLRDILVTARAQLIASTLH